MIASSCTSVSDFASGIEPFEDRLWHRAVRYDDGLRVLRSTLGSWQELPALPEAVHHLAAAATADRVYIAGGYTDLRFSAMSRHAFAYDPEARTWTAIASAAQTKPKMASRRCWNGPTPIRPSAWSMVTAGIGSSPLTACSVDLSLVRVRACCKARSSIWRAIAG